MKKRLSMLIVALLMISLVTGLAGITSGYFSNQATSSNNVVRTITNWYDLAWHWRIPITVINNGSPLSDYQLNITINTASLVTAGKLQPDGYDIRFTASDGVTNIGYWIDSGENTATTAIWIKVPSIPSGSSTIYMYYGNSYAPEASSGEGTFLFFEDFENGFTPGVKWNVLNPSAGSVELSTNTFHATRSLLISDNPNGGNIGVSAAFSPQTQCVIEYAVYFRIQGTKEMQVQDPAGNIGPRGGFAKSKAGTDTLEYFIYDWTTIGNFPANNWYQSKLKLRNTTTAVDTYDLYFYNSAGNSLAQATNLRYYNNADLSTLSRFSYLGTSTFKTETYLDLIKIRSYTETEPTYSVGVEE